MQFKLLTFVINKKSKHRLYVTPCPRKLNVFLQRVKSFLDRGNCEDLFWEERLYNYSECSNSIFGISMKVPRVQVSTSSKPKKIQTKE